VIDDPIRHGVEDRKLIRETVLLEGPCVIHVAGGSLTVRDEASDCIRVHEGDLVSVTAGGTCRLGGAREEGEILLFRAGASWTERALGLAGCAPAPAGVPFFVDRAGTDAARRGGRLLRELVLPLSGVDPDARGARGLRGAALCLELLAIAFEARRDVLAPGARRPARGVSERRTRFRAVVRALEQEPLDGVTLGHVAERLGTSERQVSRLFRSELGTTFREHMVGVRVERARTLLHETRLPVIEVAAETGWSSLGHFTVTFRRRVGQTPSGYRHSVSGVRERATARNQAGSEDRPR
jgi:AraC-like DNA-binding protein